MTNVPRYSYGSIKATEIRLLKFLKIENDGIAATLEKFSITPNLEPPPPYIALSYVWSLDGTPSTRSRHISIDGGQLFVLDSLQPFFDVLQKKETPLQDGWWWIDSICINQEDDLEKSSQVKIMNSIYSQAASTTVWLGNSSTDSDKAMDFIGSIRKLTPEIPFKAIEKELQLQRYSSHWEALESLLLRRWWSRVWTMQEFILSKVISFWCGSKTVSRMAVADALWFFYLCRPNGLHGDPAFINGWHRRRVFEWYKKSSVPESAPSFRMSLVALASYCSNNHATDDKDLLYGLCGLTPDIQLINIDYSLTVEEAYTNFTKSHITNYESLDIICFAHLYGSSAKSSLSSWVPDWRQRLKQNFVVPLMVSQSSHRGIGNFRPPEFVKRDKTSATYKASGNRIPTLQFEGSNLVVRGFVLGVVDGLGGSESFELVQPSESFTMSTEEIFKSSEAALDCLSSVLKCLILGRRDRYLQNSMVPKAFMIDFLKFCSKATQDNDSEVPTAFKDWFNRNQHFRIRGCPLESIVTYAELSNQWRLESENSISVTDPHSMNAFSGRFHDSVVRIPRRLMVSEDGFLGFAPDKSQKGDLVCILFGCNVPVVLRKTADGPKFVLIGECFIDGYMSGEALVFFWVLLKLVRNLEWWEQDSVFHMDYRYKMMRALNPLSAKTLKPWPRYFKISYLYVDPPAEDDGWDRDQWYQAYPEGIQPLNSSASRLEYVAKHNDALERCWVPSLFDRLYPRLNSCRHRDHNRPELTDIYHIRSNCLFRCKSTDMEEDGDYILLSPANHLPGDTTVEEWRMTDLPEESGWESY